MGRPNGRQARRCSARRTNGQPCKAWAISGGEVCVAHGGATAGQGQGRPENRGGEGQGPGRIKDFEPVTDPISELERLAGRAVRWLEVLEGIVADLNRIRYTTESEQIDGRIIVFERAMTTAGKLLTDLARLNLDERGVKVQEQQVMLLAGALAQALSEAGLRPSSGRRSRSGWPSSSPRARTRRRCCPRGGDDV